MSGAKRRVWVMIEDHSLEVNRPREEERSDDESGCLISKRVLVLYRGKIIR